MARIGYARISTALDQSLDPQIDILKADGCEKVFGDIASGKLARRPELDAALEYLRSGDVLTIVRLDRLGRSVKHLIDLVADLKERGVHLRVTEQGIDTSTPAGMMFFHVLAAMAEFERALIHERTMDGLAAARARGRKGGRRPVLSDIQKATARQMYNQREFTIQQIADAMRCSPATIYRALEATAA